MDNLQKSLKEKEERIKKYEIELKQLSSKPSQIDLEIQQDDLKIKVLTLTEKLDLKKASQGNISVCFVDTWKLEIYVVFIKFSGE